MARQTVLFTTQALALVLLLLLQQHLAHTLAGTAVLLFGLQLQDPQVRQVLLVQPDPPEQTAVPAPQAPQAHRAFKVLLDLPDLPEQQEAPAPQGQQEPLEAPDQLAQLAQRERLIQIPQLRF